MLLNVIIEFLSVHLRALLQLMIPLVLHVLLALQQHDLRVLFALRELLLQSLLHVLRYCRLNLLQLLLGLRGSLLQFAIQDGFMFRNLNHLRYSVFIVTLDLVSLRLNSRHSCIMSILLLLELSLVLDAKLYFEILHAKRFTGLLLLQLELFLGENALPLISHKCHIIFHFLGNKDLDLFLLVNLANELLFSCISLAQLALEYLNLLGLLFRLQS